MDSMCSLVIVLLQRGQTSILEIFSIIFFCFSISYSLVAEIFSREISFFIRFSRRFFFSARDNFRESIFSWLAFGLKSSFEIDSICLRRKSDSFEYELRVDFL